MFEYVQSRIACLHEQKRNERKSSTLCLPRSRLHRRGNEPIWRVYYGVSCYLPYSSNAHRRFPNFRATCSSPRSKCSVNDVILSCSRRAARSFPALMYISTFSSRGGVHQRSLLCTWSEPETHTEKYPLEFFGIVAFRRGARRSQFIDELI